MRRNKILILTLAILVQTFLVSSAWAIPVLQLNIPGATYVSDFNGDGLLDGPFDEGVSTNSSNFTLQALYKHALDSQIGNKEFYLSCALLSVDGQPLINGTAPLVNISINGTPINSWEYGKPELLGPHGVFDTYYYQLPFRFVPADYSAGGIFNVADLTGSADGYIHNFSLDVSGLGHNYAMVFDLYTYETGNNGQQNIDFAPFSHNASHNPTPEPASLTLLGLGLLGIWGFGKKKNKNF